MKCVTLADQTEPPDALELSIQAQPCSPPYNNSEPAPSFSTSRILLEKNTHFVYSNWRDEPKKANTQAPTLRL